MKKYFVTQFDAYHAIFEFNIENQEWSTTRMENHGKNEIYSRSGMQNI